MAHHIAGANQKVFVTQGGVFIAHEKDDILGRGTYGVVYRAHNKNDASVKKAIKIFSPDTMDEAEGIPSTTLREINALKTIVHPNVMTAEEVVIPETRSSTDMFFVMELCKGTLKDKIIDLIKEYLNNDPIWLNPTPNMKLPDSYIKCVKIITWQLLNSLAVVHSRGVMHRDLKPVNILWGFDDLLKLADFGLARFVRGNQNSDQTVLQQTGEVQTMWYRAPEVLLGDEKYGLLVDDWSLGCVIAELFRFRRNSSGRIEPAPLFQGRSDIGTLMIIFETLGTPQPEKISGHEYLSHLKYWNTYYPKWYDSTIKSRIPLLDTQGHDLLEMLLKLSPTERRASRFLLNHPWFNDVKPQLKQFIPWYRGFEEHYMRMLAVDRLPLPKTLKEVNMMKKNTENNSASSENKVSTQNTTDNNDRNNNRNDQNLSNNYSNTMHNENNENIYKSEDDSQSNAPKYVLLGSTHGENMTDDDNNLNNDENKNITQQQRQQQREIKTKKNIPVIKSFTKAVENKSLYNPKHTSKTLSCTSRYKSVTNVVPNKKSVLSKTHRTLINTNKTKSLRNISPSNTKLSSPKQQQLFLTSSQFADQKHTKIHSIHTGPRTRSATAAAAAAATTVKPDEKY